MAKTYVYLKPMVTHLCFVYSVYETFVILHYPNSRVSLVFHETLPFNTRLVSARQDQQSYIISTYLPNYCKLYGI